MGGGSSSQAAVTQNNQVITVNNTTTTLLNQQFNQTISNTIINQATSCGATSQTTLTSLFKDIIAKGDINIDNTMSTHASIDISCISASNVGNAVGSSISGSLSGQIAQAFNTLANQAGQATTGAETNTSFDPFQALAKNVSSASIKQYNVTNTTNNSQTFVESVINNVTQSTFTNSIITELQSRVIADMAATYSNLQAGGNVNITNLMSSTQTIIAQQVANMGIGNSITSQLLNVFGVKVATTATTEATQTAKGEAEATATATGIFQSLGQMFQSIGTAFGNLFSGIFGGIFGSLTQYVSSICMFVVICCCCCISCIFMFGLLGSGSDSGSGNEIVTNPSPELGDTVGGYIKYARLSC